MSVNTKFAVGLSITWILFLCIPAETPFEIAALGEHNMYRDKHNCPPLLLDDALTEESRAYAEELAQKDVLEHSTGDYGENLCMTTGDPLTCVRMWYDEIKDYDFDRGKFSLETGHFTQVVWMSSKWLGIGKAKSKSGKMYVVGRYSPAGNVEGQFIDNVPKLKNSSTSYNKSFSSQYLILFAWTFSALLLWIRKF